MDPIVIILGLVAAFIVGSLIYKFFIKKPSIKIEPEVVSREPVVKDSIRYSTQSNSLRSSNHRQVKQDQLSRAIDANDLLAAAVVSSSLMSDDDSRSRSTRSYSSDYDSDSKSSYGSFSSSNYSSSSYDSGSSSSDSSSSSSSGGSD